MNIGEDTRWPEPTPPRPKRLSVTFHRSSDSVTLDYRYRGWVTVGCLATWLTGWTFGCVALIMSIVQAPGPFLVFIGIVFCSWWVLVAACLIIALFGRERVVLDRGGVSFVRRAIVILCRRNVPLSEIRSFARYTEVSGGRSRTERHGIELQTAGESLRFCEGVSISERDWLTFQLNDHLRSNRVTDEHPEPLGAAPPSDSRWLRSDDRGAIVFADRGWFNLFLFLGLLGINSLWNGIVSVFVLGLCGVGAVAPQEAAWWFVFVLLIPFEFFGVGLFLSLVVTIIEPVRRATWRFGNDSIEFRQTWFGWGSVRTFSVAGAQQIELREVDPCVNCFSYRSLALDLVSRGGTLGRTRQLVLIGPSDAELCTIDALTEGEAEWIAAVLRRERPNWLGNVWNGRD
jgi:hypothetical protein